jgi:hypothetical protein
MIRIIQTIKIIIILILTKIIIIIIIMTILTKKKTNNDNNHIGNINKYDIVVAAPWNYGREFTTLHEIAHLVFEKLVTEKQKQEWDKLCKKFYNKKPKMNCEEVFCMVYACNYSTHKVETYNVPKLINFVKRV